MGRFAFWKKRLEKKNKREAVQTEKPSVLPAPVEKVEEDLPCEYTGALHPVVMGKGEFLRYEKGGSYSTRCVWIHRRKGDKICAPRCILCPRFITVDEQRFGFRYRV